MDLMDSFISDCAEKNERFTLELRAVRISPQVIITLVILTMRGGGEAKEHRRETALIDRQIFLSLEAAAWSPDIHPDMQMKIGPQQERGALNQAT